MDRVVRLISRGVARLREALPFEQGKPGFRWRSAEQALSLAPQVVLHHWRQLIAVATMAGLFGVSVSYLVPKRFTAIAAFVPITGPQLPLRGGLVGLAAQYALSTTSTSGLTPDLYAELVETRAIRAEVVLRRYYLPKCTGSDARRGDLIQAFGFERKEQAAALDAAVRRLARMTTTRFEPVTSLVSISVEACDPNFAAAIVTAYLRSIQRFTERTLRIQARATREFAEGRLAEVGRELATAEDRLTEFYRNNRTFQQSPVLQQQEVRLRRQVSLLEETYVAVRTEYERSRLDEYRQLPALTIVDPPVPPARKSWPKRWLFGVLSATFAAGLVLVGQMAALREPDPAS